MLHNDVIDIKDVALFTRKIKAHVVDWSLIDIHVHKTLHFVYEVSDFCLFNSLQHHIFNDILTLGDLVQQIWILMHNGKIS